MKPLRGFVGGAAWNVAGKLFQFGIGLAAIAVIARWVGPEAYGLFTLTWVAVGLVEILVASGPIDALVQRGVVRPGHLAVTFWGGLVVALLSWLGLALAAGPVAGLLGGGAVLAMILPLRAATLPMSAMGAVPVALLMREERFKSIAAAEAVAGVISSVTGIAAAIYGAGIWSLVAMEVVRQAVHTAMVWRASRWLPGFTVRREDAADLVAFNLRTWAAWTLNWVDGQLPRLVIGHVLGPQALGYFALANRLLDQVLGVLLVPIYQVVMAGVSRRQGDVEAVERLVRSIQHGAAVAACPVFLGLAAVAPILVPLVFGAAWAGAVPVVQLMLLLGVRASTHVVQVSVIRAMGRPDWHLRGVVVGLGLTVVMVPIASIWGLEVLSAAIVVKGFLLWPLYAIYVQTLTGLDWRRQIAAVAGPVAAGLSMLAGTSIVVGALQGATHPVVALVGSIVCGVLIYAAGLAVFAREAFRMCVSAAGSIVRRDRVALLGLIEQR